MIGCSSVTRQIPAYVGNYTKNRARYGKISEITVHHAAGIVSVDALGSLWQRKGRNGSSHYGVSGAQIGNMFPKMILLGQTRIGRLTAAP